jgi:hypothetical protein
VVVQMSDVIQTTTRQAGGWLSCNNLEAAMKLAEMFSKSAMVPKQYQGNAANCLVAMAYGDSLGMAPLQAMQSVAVVNGVPALYGDGMLALVQASPVFESIEESIEDGAAVCTVKRRGMKPVQRVFTIDDAKRAGLWGKAGPWQQYPSRMLQMRARSWALRDAFADVLRGIQSVEEVRDIPEVIDVTPPPALPEPKAATKAEQVLGKFRARKPRPPEPEPGQQPVAAAAAEPEAVEPAAEIDRSRIEEIGRRWATIYQPDHGFVKLLRALYRSSAEQAAGMATSVDKAVDSLDHEDQDAARADVLEVFAIIEGRRN